MSDLHSAPPRRLTMAITELNIGGAEKAFVRIAAGLRGRGWDIQVISLRGEGPLSEPLRKAEIPVTALHCGGFADTRAVWRMKKALEQRRPDVLLTFLHQANIMGRLAGRLAGVPGIFSGIRVADRRWSVAIPERLTSCCVDHYVAVSHNVAAIHGQICRIPMERFNVIPNGVDFDAIVSAEPADRSLMQCAPNDVVILCVGRLFAQKAPLDVLEAFRLFRAQNPEHTARLQLRFVGDGPLRSRLQARIRKHSLNDCVKLLGWRADVWNLMKASNVLVLASHWEGLPGVILEAQAAGLPVIASDVDGTTELIIDGATGRLFPAGDVNRLVGALCACLASPEHSRRMAESAQENVTASYRWDACISKFDTLLAAHIENAGFRRREE